jgi:hypothetical protein
MHNEARETEPSIYSQPLFMLLWVKVKAATKVFPNTLFQNSLNCKKDFEIPRNLELRLTDHNSHATKGHCVMQTWYVNYVLHNIHQYQVKPGKK